jgi:hypothetical protein
MKIFIKGGLGNTNWEIDGDYIILENVNKLPVFTKIDKKISIHTISKISPIRKQGFIKGFVDVEYNGKEFPLTSGGESYDDYVKTIEYLRLIVESEKPIYISNLDLANYCNDKSIDEISLRLFNDIKDNKILVNNDPLEFLRVITTLKKNGAFDKINELTLKYCDEYAIENGFMEYSLTELISTTIPNIEVGDYFYQLNDRGDTSLLRIPVDKKIIVYQDPSTFLNAEDIFIYPKSIESQRINLKIEQIQDFEVSGTQLSMVQSNNTHNNPKLLKTMFVELLFGASYAILKGLSKSTINISSRIEDLRIVQLIIDGNEDIRFKGVSIYYDLNRYLGFNKLSRSGSIKQDQMDDPLMKLKKLKEMLEIGLINQEEFDKKKNEILDSI